MIHAASRQALDVLRERLNDALSSLPTDGGASNATLADELYAVAALLVEQPRLRRTLADPATDASGRSELARSLFAGQIEEPALDVVAVAVGQRWSSSWDLTDGLEIAADDTLLSAAEQQGTLDDVEDELFRIERILANSGDLVAALDEAAVPAERRIGLLKTLLDGKANPITVQLLSHAVSSGRKRNLELAIDDLLEASAARRERSVARVISAAELSSAQTERLAAALTSMYGRPINVRSAVDPGIGGGLSVRVGDDVIDATVATRLANARAALAG
ncbi:MAG TPA: F0F1 ATP synthase subunit delta [Jatrophihabitans sp.]|jgi:F-type H+-transporting ATPase subunit delta